MFVVTEKFLYLIKVNSDQSNRFQGKGSEHCYLALCTLRK